MKITDIDIKYVLPFVVCKILFVVDRLSVVVIVVCPLFIFSIKNEHDAFV